MFAWTAAQLEFLAEQAIKLKANKTLWLNTILAQLLDRGEQAIRKIRTKTEYRQAEMRVDKGRMITTEKLPTPKASSLNADQLHTPKSSVRSKRKFPDLANIIVEENSPFTTRQLLDTSSIPITPDVTTPIPRITKEKARFAKTPRRLPPTPNTTASTSTQASNQ